MGLECRGTSHSCDVAILGGGPAGAAVALALRCHNPALQVAIIERSDYSAPRIGETLPPNAAPLLKALGVWLMFTQRGYLPAYGTAAAWGQSRRHDNPFVFGMRGCGWHLDRRDFDKFLADEAVRRGAVLYTKTIALSHAWQPDGRWRLTAQKLDSPIDDAFELTSRFVVDATGRSAQFARQHGARRIVFDRLAGAAMILPAHQTDSYTLVEACESGWWYSALLPANQMIVAHMTDADLMQAQQLRDPHAWQRQLAASALTRERVCLLNGHASLPSIYAAYTHRLDRVTGQAWLAVGDASSTFDPLSSQGVVKAMQSGLFAAYAILDFFKGDLFGLERYAAWMAAALAGYISTWRNYYAVEQRWPDAAFWQRRHRLMM